MDGNLITNPQWGLNEYQALYTTRTVKDWRTSSIAKATPFLSVVKHGAIF